MKLDVKTYEERMKKTLTAYEKDLESIRLGRATPVVLNKITVDYYGCPTQISQMAEVKAIDARTLTITPWDSTTLRSIEKAIHESDLGIGNIFFDLVSNGNCGIDMARCAAACKNNSHKQFLSWRQKMMMRRMVGSVYFQTDCVAWRAPLL